MVSLRIAGSEPLLAMIDTGFEGNILDRDVARRLKLHSGPVRKEAQPGGTLTTTTLRSVALTLGGFRVEQVAFSTLPIAALGAVLGRPTVAILGHAFLKRFVVELDYGRGLLRLWEPPGWRYRGSGATLPVRFLDEQVLVDCELGLPSGRKLVAPYKLDTGSLSLAGLALNYVKNAKIIEPGIHERIVSGIAMGGSTEARVFRAHHFRLGKTVVENPTMAYVVEAGGFENRKFAGTVGAPILMLHNLILDYPRKRIFLERRPQVHLAEDLSGMYLVSPPPEFSVLVVAQVFPGGAADTAGLKEGDQVLAIDGVPCKLEKARRLLQLPQARTLHYRRGEREFVTTLQPQPYPPLG